jgi:iron complex outermembrane receptor protein
VIRRALLLALLMPAFALAAGVSPLGAGDVAALLKPPARGVRILAIWSLDCAYCEAHLQALAKLQQAHPRQIELITIATDSIAQREPIAARLHGAGIDAWPARAYADDTPERIDYLIDPDWGGETPRTVVIRADGSRESFSGAATERRLDALL